MAKRIIIGIIILGALWGAFNFSYYRQLLDYHLHHRDNNSQQTQARPEPREKMTPNDLQIPSLDVETPVLYADAIDDKQFDSDLAYGAVHYPNTAAIGEAGNAYIFGNSSDYPWKPGGRFKTIFALLPKIQAGDEIAVSDSTGDKFIYKVTETKIVAPTELSVLSQGDRTKKLLTLQTCWPIGTALKRFIVIAELEQ